MGNISPTLHYMVDPVLEESVDVMYLVRHFIYNPGFTSSLFSDYELSFRGIATRYPIWMLMQLQVM